MVGHVCPYGVWLNNYYQIKYILVVGISLSKTNVSVTIFLIMGLNPGRMVLPEAGWHFR